VSDVFAVSSVVAEGPAAGCRAVDLRVAGGIDLRVLPDRGLDLGAAWFRGVPVAWISPLGERPPRPGDFTGSWGGGLVTTCGLRNVGAPSEGHGQHGEYHQQRASEVGVERGEGWVAVRGRVREGSLEVSRAIRTFAGEGRVELVDVARNLGAEAEPAPLLYHVNIGAPVWGVGARLSVSGSLGIEPRDADAAAALGSWDRAPGVIDGAPERVFEHVVEPGADGWCEVRLDSPPAGLVLTLRWDAATLPRMHQWVHPAPEFGVLGLEPANCSVLGRAADRAAGRLPELAPGEERVTRLELRAEG
jgi:hypothetical protein